MRVFSVGPFGLLQHLTYVCQRAFRACLKECTIVYLLVFYMNFSRQRTSPIHASETITYKNVDLLRRFITEQGKILPRRLTGVTAKQQRQLSRAVKQARILGFLQFLNKE